MKNVDGTKVMESESLFLRIWVSRSAIPVDWVDRAASFPEDEPKELIQHTRMATFCSSQHLFPVQFSQYAAH